MSAPPASTAWKCPECGDESYEEEVKIGHDPVCRDCIRRTFTMATEGEQYFPPRHGSRKLRIENFLDVFDDEFVERYERLTAEWECREFERIYCSHAERADSKPSQFIGKRRSDRDRLCRRCKVCELYVCMACGKLFATAMKEDDADDVGEGKNAEGAEEDAVVEKAAEEKDDAGEEEESKDGGGGDAREEHADGGEDDVGGEEEEAPALEELRIDHVCQPQVVQQAGVDYQTCPDCEQREPFHELWNHITCDCGTHFCFICGQKVEQDVGRWEEHSSTCPYQGQREEEYSSSEEEEDAESAFLRSGRSVLQY